MPTAENAKLQYEGGQTAFAMAALTDSGDRTIFDAAASPWSKKSGSASSVLPNGLLTGGAVIPAISLTNNLVDTAALTCNLNGVASNSVPADTDIAITRGSTNGFRTTSITVNSSGNIAAVAGTESTSASETRGAAGGPPYIPVGSIEIAQVRLTSITAGAILASEILAVPGLHKEEALNPVYSVNYTSGKVTFAAALPAIHTGDVSKAIYASYSTPVFSDIALASDFVPPENSHSVSSTQVYRATIGSTSKSLNQGTFTAFFEDGVTDALVTLKDETLWFKFFPDQYKTPYILSQGILGMSRTFPAGDSLQATCTISAEEVASENAS